MVTTPNPRQLQLQAHPNCGCSHGGSYRWPGQVLRSTAETPLLTPAAATAATALVVGVTTTATTVGVRRCEKTRPAAQVLTDPPSGVTTGTNCGPGWGVAAPTGGTTPDPGFAGMAGGAHTWCVGLHG